MNHSYQISDPAAAYFLTLQVIDWVDVFSRRVYRDIVLDSLTYCRQHKGLEVFGYVVMTNHVHLMVRARHENLSDVLRDLKKFTANTILKEIAANEVESRKDWMLKRFEFAAQRHVRNSTRQFWTHENHAIEIITNKFIDQKLNYIHQNPVRAGWVEEPQEYLYSSARNYAGRQALIDIDLL
ncbi:transposase [Spirosoma soli]|uniref:Transposase n=1 Tax=Spirosoma soli TaxID=1770529 RepID=A0ABW5M3B4_9BACT